MTEKINIELSSGQIIDAIKGMESEARESLLQKFGVIQLYDSSIVQDLESALELKTRSLEETNTALKILLKHRGEEIADIEKQYQTIIKKLVMPNIENLKRLKLNEKQVIQVRMIENNLQEIFSSFLHNLTSAFFELTPREIQVAQLIKEGRTTNEIVDILSISAITVAHHRRNLRLKLGIRNKRENLRSCLNSLSLSYD